MAWYYITYSICLFLLEDGLNSAFISTQVLLMEMLFFSISYHHTVPPLSLSLFIWGSSESGRFLQGGEPVLSASIIPPTQDTESDVFISQKQGEGAIKMKLSGLSGWITQDLQYTSSNQPAPLTSSSTLFRNVSIQLRMENNVYVCTMFLLSGKNYKD